MLNTKPTYNAKLSVLKGSYYINVFILEPQEFDFDRFGFTYISIRLDSVESILTGFSNDILAMKKTI